jgi:outer membrane protein assembly factor BamB
MGIAVSEQPMITFASHQARAGMAGASEDFEQMLGLLVRATSGEASLVFANPGDWGIDVLVGDLRGRVTVWQAKYFTRGVGRSQQGQITESFASALRAAARHGYALERWVLCIPASMDGPTMRWWQGWKAGQERDTGVVIGLWDETRLRELLLRPEAGQVRRHYYNPYRRDGQPGAPAAAAADQPRAPVPPTPAESDPGARGGSRIRRRAVIIGVVGASAAALLPAAREIFSDSVPVRTPAWTYATGSYVDCTPAVANGVVYAGDDSGRVHALHATTGELLWITPDGAYPVFTRPSVVGDTVYVGSNSRQGICALDTAAHGSVTRTYRWGGDVRSGITIADGIAYYGSWDHHSVYAVDTGTGRLRWPYPTGKDVQSTPAVVNGTVYFGSQDQCVYALDAVTGRPRWKTPTEGFILSSPAVADGVVYICSGDGLVYALDAAHGYIIRTYPTGGQIQFSDPVVADGTVYIGSMDGKVYALDAASSLTRWAAPLSSPIKGSPAVSAGRVYIGATNGKLYALDAATGHIQWAYATRRAITRGPALAGGLVYIGSQDGTIYAFSTAPLWITTQPGDGKRSRPIAGHNHAPTHVAITNHQCRHVTDDLGSAALRHPASVDRLTRPAPPKSLGAALESDGTPLAVVTRAHLFGSYTPWMLLQCRGSRFTLRAEQPGCCHSPDEGASPSPGLAGAVPMPTAGAARAGSMPSGGSGL